VLSQGIPYQGGTILPCTPRGLIGGTQQLFIENDLHG
jgi:hypothetical protein